MTPALGVIVSCATSPLQRGGKRGETLTSKPVFSPYFSVLCQGYWLDGIKPGGTCIFCYVLSQTEHSGVVMHDSWSWSMRRRYSCCCCFQEVKFSEKPTSMSCWVCFMNLLTGCWSSIDDLSAVCANKLSPFTHVSVSKQRLHDQITLLHDNTVGRSGL